MTPPLAVAFGAMFLDAPVTLWSAVDGALVVGGIAVAQHTAIPRGSSSVAPSPSASSAGAT